TPGQVAEASLAERNGVMAEVAMFGGESGSRNENHDDRRRGESQPHGPPPLLSGLTITRGPPNREARSPRPTQDRVAAKGLVHRQVIDGEMQPAALAPAHRAVDDQRRHRGDVAELDEVGGDQEVPIILADLLLEELEAAFGARQAAIAA